jgi:hypothetical protein
VRDVFFSLLLFVLAGSANACPEQFVCTQVGCERVPVASCSSGGSPANQVHHSTSGSTTFGPSHSALFSNQTSAVSTSVSPVVERSAPQAVLPPAQQPPGPAYAPGCAENGSCFGAISTVNGMPKTSYVNGYFRRDGTYVRGHYRSNGRR